MAEGTLGQLMTLSLSEDLREVNLEDMTYFELVYNVKVS